MAPQCEGWKVAEEDCYCPRCGSPLRQLELSVEIQKVVDGPWLECSVLGRQPARLRLSNSSELACGGALKLPAWLGCQSGEVTLAAGAEEVVELQVSQAELESLTPIETIRWSEARLSVCFSGPARVQVEWSSTLVDPQSRLAWVAGRLLVQQGAIWLGALPEWIECERPEGGILSARGPHSLDFRYRWEGQPRHWELGPDLVLCLEPEVSKAGWLQAPTHWSWPLRGVGQQLLEVRAQGGPVLIEAVESSHPQIEVELPGLLSPESSAFLRLSYLGEWPEAGERCQLQLRLSDGRRHRLEVDVTCPKLQEFAGWLVIDLGSSASSAALLWDDGRLESVQLTPESPYLPSGLRYHGDGTIEATAEQGPDVIWQAKRCLGLGHTLGRVQIGDRFKDLTPFQVVRDTFRALFQALFEVDGLADFSFPRIALCHPVGFSPRQVGELERALRAAGAISAQVVTMSEPLAAAFHALSGQIHPLPQRVWRLLCLDFGAMTSDVALLRVDSRDGARVTVELEAVGGDRWFGGWDITRWLAELLPAEVKEQAEEMKCKGGLPPELLSALEERVKARLPLSLPRRGELSPDRILLTGRGSAYPAIEAFLRERFPGVVIQRSSHPKECVVLGAARHPELARSLGPRYFGPEGTYLQLPERPEKPVFGVRLGLKILGPQGAEFYPMVEPGSPMNELGASADLARISLQPGTNPIEVLENLGWEDSLVGPDGQPNPQIVSLLRLDLWIEGSLHPAETRLCWQISCDYQIYLSVYHQGQRVSQAGPLPLW